MREAASGIEPLNRGFADPRLTTWLRRPDYGSPARPRGNGATRAGCQLTCSLKCMPRWRWRQPGVRPDQGNLILNYSASLRGKPESSDCQLGKLGVATVFAGAGFPPRIGVRDMLARE